MITIIAYLSLMADTANVPAAPPPGPAPEVQKEIRYQKETMVDLSGSNVEGENSAPPAFFVTKMQTPNAASLLAERLKLIDLRRFNDLGF